MANGTTPQPSPGVTLQDEDRLQQILGDPAQRTLALGTAAQQFFDPTLSGEQSTLVQGAIKNRIARGLRGSAAEAFGQRIEQQFAEQNRLAAAGFLQRAFGVQAGELAQRAPGIGRSLISGGGIAGLEAFGAEVSGLRALGIQQGPGAITEFIESRQAAGERAQALQSIFPSLSTEDVTAILNPEEAVQNLIAEQRNELQSALALTEAGGPLQMGESALRVGVEERPDLLGAPLILQLTPENLSRLNLPDPTEIGGLQRLNETVDLRERFAQAFPDFPADMDIRATAVLAQRPGGGAYNPLTGNRTATQELVGALEINPSNLTSRLQAISKVVPGVGKRATQFAQNIESLEDFRRQVQNPLQNLNLLPNLRGQLEGIRAQSPELARATKAEAQKRPTFFEDAADPFAEQLSRLEEQLSQTDELRESFFSPTNFFGA